MPLQKLSSDRGGGRLPRALEGRTEVARLLDVYAEMLTGHQRDLLRLYYHEDFSLGEIASGLGVTRQAVFDGLRRSVAEMQHLEGRLRLLADRDRRTRTREEATLRLAAVEQEAAHLAQASGVDAGPLLRAVRALREVL
jgi:uncharacterized protein